MLEFFESIHPVPNMGPHTADYVSHAGSDLAGFIRFTEQIPADPTGGLDDITPMHTMLQYQAYRLPPSEYLYVEGIPADLRGTEIPGLI